jgi:hypothetical protein
MKPTGFHRLIGKTLQVNPSTRIVPAYGELCYHVQIDDDGHYGWLPVSCVEQVKSGKVEEEITTRKEK